MCIIHSLLCIIRCCVFSRIIKQQCGVANTASLPQDLCARKCVCLRLSCLKLKSLHYAYKGHEYASHNKKKRLCLQARMCNCSVQALQLLVKISSVIHKHLVCVIVIACRVRLSISSHAMQGRPPAHKSTSQVSNQALADSQRHLCTSTAYLLLLLPSYFSQIALRGSVLCYETPVCVCSVRLVSPLLKCVTHFPPRALFCWIQRF